MNNLKMAKPKSEIKEEKRKERCNNFLAYLVFFIIVIGIATWIWIAWFNM